VERFIRASATEVDTWAADPNNRARLAEVRHVLVRVPEDGSAEAEAKKRALALLDRIKKGEDFAAVARDGSDDSGTKGRGGAVGTDTSKFVEPFRVAADALAPGEVTGELVRSSFGWHIIKKDPITPEGIRAAYRRQAAPDVAKRLAAEILEKRRTGQTLDIAIARAAASMLEDGAIADSGHPVAHTFDAEMAKASIEACRDPKEKVRRFLAQEHGLSTQESLLCIELEELSRFAVGAAPGATLTLPIPPRKTPPLIAFATSIP
jgi:hypothetical protein